MRTSVFAFLAVIGLAATPAFATNTATTAQSASSSSAAVTAQLNTLSSAGAFAAGGAGGNGGAGGAGGSSVSSGGSAVAGTGNTSFDGGDTHAWGISYNPPPFSPSAGPANTWGIVETDAVGFPLIGGGYQDQRVNYAPATIREYAGLLMTAWGVDPATAAPDSDAVKVSYTASLCALVPQFAKAGPKLTRIDCDQ